MGRRLWRTYSLIKSLGASLVRTGEFTPKRMGMMSLSSFSGRPEGLSLRKISRPLPSAGVVKSRVTSNGTKSSVIHSPLAWAGTCARIFPSASSISTGKLSSKYQGPRASPLTKSGLSTMSLGCGVSTRMKSFFLSL